MPKRWLARGQGKRLRVVFFRGGAVSQVQSRSWSGSVPVQRTRRGGFQPGSVLCGIVLGAGNPGLPSADILVCVKSRPARIARIFLLTAGCSRVSPELQPPSQPVTEPDAFLIVCVSPSSPSTGWAPLALLTGISAVCGGCVQQTPAR